MGLVRIRFHLEPVVVADEGKRFNFGDGFIPQKFLVEMGELARSGGAGFQIKLWGVTRRGEPVSHLARYCRLTSLQHSPSSLTTYSGWPPARGRRTR
jgi:hypothetical protein